MDASPLPVVPATLDVGCEVVFRTLSDGRRHAFDGFPGLAPDAVRRDLDALRSLGMSMQLDDSSVQTAPFVALDAAAISSAIGDCAGPAGPPRWRVDVAFALGSTNTDLLHDAKRRSARATPRLLAAEIQHAGRGRLGRDWSAVPGAAITASFAIPVSRGMTQLDGVTLVCGLAVRHVVAARGLPVRLKWPNDLLVDGRKLAGILVEAHGTPTGTTLVIGVGLNVAPSSLHLARAATLPSAHLAHDASTPVDRNALVGALAGALDAHLARFAFEGFEPFVDAWNAADAFADRPVRLESPPTPTVTGVARGVDHRGALLLDVGGERRRIIAGDVSLRPALVATGSA